MKPPPTAIEHLDVICYRWGDRYGPEDVTRLAAMVKRHLSIPHTFHCITDRPDSVPKPLQAHPLPDFGVQGIWRKLMTFQRNFLGLEGRFVVSFDLDVVIVGSLDFLGDRPEEPFLIGRNWARDSSRARGSGTLYRLKVGSHAFIWERFIADPKQAIDQFHGKNREIGEQNWLNANIDEFSYFPDGKIVSFKRHCGARGHSLAGQLGERLGLTTAVLGQARPPAGAAVISFHGDPLPPQVMHGRSGRWRHAPFVAEHWREDASE